MHTDAVASFTALLISCLEVSVTVLLLFGGVVDCDMGCVSTTACDSVTG